MIELLDVLNTIIEKSTKVEVEGHGISIYFDSIGELKSLFEEISGLENITFYIERTEKEVPLSDCSEPFYVSLQSDEIKFVSSEYGLVSRIIGNQQDPIESLNSNVYFLESSKTFLTSSAPFFEKLESLATLTEFFSRVSDDYSNKNYVFWSDGKFLLNNSLEQTEFEGLAIDKSDLEDFIEKVEVEEHHLERVALFKVALKKVIGDSSKDVLTLNEFLSKFESIKRLWSEGYYAYLHDLDFDEIREKLIEKVDATHDAIGKVLSGAQIRVLAIPLAIIVSASQFTKINDIWFMAAAFVGLALLVSAGYLLFENADEDVEAVESRFDNWVENFENSKIIYQFDRDIEILRERILRQKRRIHFLKIFNLIFSLVVLIVTFTSVAFGSEKNYGNTMVDKVTSIYDGDTFRANIKDWPPVVGYRIPIRVNGIDTPEIRGKCQTEKTLARKAKQITVQILRAAKTIELRNIQRGKYFRLVADVYVDGKSLADELIRKNLAVPYGGGAKQGWCINSG